MKLYQNTLSGLRHRGWTRAEAIAYFIKGVARELKIAPAFFEKNYETYKLVRWGKDYFKFSEKEVLCFREKWLKQNEEESWFDFGICKLPNISNLAGFTHTLMFIFEDTLQFPCFLNDNYAKHIVNHFDHSMRE
jgi:hypothetical protein